MPAADQRINKRPTHNKQSVGFNVNKEPVA